MTLRGLVARGCTHVHSVGVDEVVGWVLSFCRPMGHAPAQDCFRQLHAHRDVTPCRVYFKTVKATTSAAPSDPKKKSLERCLQVG